MKTQPNKVCTMAEAVDRFVPDGAHISIGGFTVTRNPMAGVYEIIRQRRKNLHLYVHSNGQGADELIGGGCVSAIELAYGGNGKFAATCIRFRRAAEQGAIAIEDYSNYQMSLRFLAGAMGVPFLPTRSGLGTDLVEKQGFSPWMRQQDPKLPDQKLIVTDNPFGQWKDVRRLVLVPAITPDITLLHVQQADSQGTARIQGLSFADIEQARASRHVIVSCEELVDKQALRAAPHQNSLSFLHVDAVVHAPFGAYPTACYRYYDYDPAYLKMYAAQARDETRYQRYLDEYIFGISDHDALLEKVGKARLDGLQADPETGYSRGLDRR